MKRAVRKALFRCEQWMVQCSPGEWQPLSGDRKGMEVDICHGKVSVSYHRFPQDATDLWMVILCMIYIFIRSTFYDIVISFFSNYLYLTQMLSLYLNNLKYIFLQRCVWTLAALGMQLETIVSTTATQSIGSPQYISIFNLSTSRFEGEVNKQFLKLCRMSLQDLYAEVRLESLETMENGWSKLM